MTEDVGIKLDKTCRAVNVKLMLVRSFGLVGYLRVNTSSDNCNRLCLSFWKGGVFDPST